MKKKRSERKREKKMIAMGRGKLKGKRGKVRNNNGTEKGGKGEQKLTSKPRIIPQ